MSQNTNSKINKTVREVCKIGQGAECCRYLGLDCSSKDFSCEKKTYNKQVIDKRVGRMNAKGDNCEGQFGAIK